MYNEINIAGKNKIINLNILNKLLSSYLIMNAVKKKGA